tara:strand:- start:2132 stop:2719 length:588 start_codon:yes stop_codon:yes gene_type:complete
MIKKLKHTKEIVEEKIQHITTLKKLTLNTSIEDFVVKGTAEYSQYTIEFYEVIGDILEEIGFQKVSVTREGDTNNRMDAIIIDEKRSIPIEIKSPKEIEYINIKSVRQALENKIVLLSRKFYPTQKEVSSLAIGFEYPNDRSGVYEAIDDIYETFNISVGIISFGSLLRLFFEKTVNKKEIDLEEIYYLKGIYND